MDELFSCSAADIRNLPVCEFHNFPIRLSSLKMINFKIYHTDKNYQYAVIRAKLDLKPRGRMGVCFDFMDVYGGAPVFQTFGHTWDRFYSLLKPEGTTADGESATADVPIRWIKNKGNFRIRLRLLYYNNKTSSWMLVAKKGIIITYVSFQISESESEFTFSEIKRQFLDYISN